MVDGWLMKDALREPLELALLGMDKLLLCEPSWLDKLQDKGLALAC